MGRIAMNIVDPASPVPVYAQIIEQVKRAIASGVLQSGETLPSRRELALKLGINPLTVLKAYKQLESEGLITVRQGFGSFVADHPDDAVQDYRMQRISRAIDVLVNDARDFGISFEKIEKMVHEQIRLASEVDGDPG